jgi:hypothetical protein
VGAALKGLYSAKKYDQRDADLGFLIVKLGNRKLAYALNKEVGAASKSTVHRMCDPTRFLCCAGTKAVAIIRENMDRFIFSQPHPPKRCLWVLGVDDVAVDERLRFSKALGVVLGLCRGHSGGVDVSIQGLACLERISAALKAGEVHMAKEATVGALLPIRRENYQARPVFASGTCKKDETAVSIMHHPSLSGCHRLLVYEKDEGHKQRGPIADTAGSQVRCYIRSRRAKRTAC